MRSMSETAMADVVKLYGGRQWAELMDIRLPASFVATAEDEKWMGLAPDGRHHVLVTNAGTPVCMAAEGWSVSGYTSGYKIFWDVPYQRDEVEDAQEQSGFVKTRIAVGDTSGVIASVMRRTNGLGGLDVNISFAMLEESGLGAIRRILEAPWLTDREAKAVAKAVAPGGSGWSDAWGVASLEASDAVYSVVSNVAGVGGSLYIDVHAYRNDDAYMEHDYNTSILASKEGVVSYDDIARGTQDGMFVRFGHYWEGYGLANVLRLNVTSSYGVMASTPFDAFPPGGALKWAPLSGEKGAAVADVVSSSEDFAGRFPYGYMLSMAPDVEYSFVSGEASHDRERFCLQLSTRNPLPWRFPSRNIYKAACLWAFKSPECGYAGAAATCDKTIATCRSLQNIERIGCFPGCGTGGLAQ